MRYEFYALLAAFSFGLNAVLVRKGMRDSTPVTATLSVAAVQVVILSGILALDPPDIEWPAIIYFVFAGFLAAIMGRTMNYLSIDKLGVPISSSLTGTNPIFAMILGVLFLGERITVYTLTGAVLVVIGVMTISGFGSKKSIRARDLAIPIGSAFFYAASSAVRKAGLNILPESVLGAFVGALTGLIAYPVILRLMGRTGEFKLSRKSIPYLSLGGIATSLAWIGMFYATQQGSIGVVSAIIGANPLFGLLLSAIILKDAEKISFRVILGSILIVTGVALITIF
ncbi:EamA family transporter [Candidatus Bathyarchaeota archaeon]|nr:EamA family transporter [Candidatus Bathyarchaeota archaeon]